MKKNSKQLDRALKALDEFRNEVRDSQPDELDAIELETRLQEVLNRIGCECMREVLGQADATAPTVEYAGETWGNRRESPGTYTTMFGDIDVARGIYSKGGGGPVLVPLDQRLGIVERRYTPKMGRLMTRAIAVMTSNEAEGLLREAGVGMVSRSTLSRVPKAVAARYETKRETIEEAVREEDSVPDAAAVAQISLDGVMVGQDGEHAKPRGRKTKRPSPPRHEIRYSGPQGVVPANDDGESGRAWHEATVGTVAFWDAEGEHLKTIYVGRMPEPGQETVVCTLDEEVRSVLAQRPDLDVSFASDGDQHQWTMLEGIAAGLPENGDRQVTFNLDFWHAATYLHEAANASTDDEAAAAVLAQQWKTTLKEYEDGARRVLKSMRYHRDRRRGEKYDEIDACIGYISKQSRAGRLNYKASLDIGHPIGTGPAEAAAKTLVNVRMKRAGARYDQHGGQTILTFRASVYSERFDALWAQLHASYTGTVRERAA